MSDFPPVSISAPTDPSASTSASTPSNRSRKRQANEQRKAPYTKSSSNRKTNGHGGSHGDDGDGSQAQGTSKLKAAIRQTNRMLARENLDPALRISTQRRLTSLQNDLALAQSKTVERENGKRYHMVKFFDRKKLLRIITRAQRLLQDSDSEKETKRLEEELWQARVMVNYVDTWHNSQKYISLFPITSSENDAPPDTDHHLSLPPHLQPTPSTSDKKSKSKGKGKKTDKGVSVSPDSPSVLEPGLDETSSKRLEILHKIEAMMRSGELSSEPEKVDKATKGGVKVNVNENVASGSSKRVVGKGGEVKPAKGGKEKDVMVEEEEEEVSEDEGMEDDFFE